ncbi:MAG TPA: FAD-binding protein [Ligilactobacillus acidipiscis]|uniref:FAD-binding protein n=1 Tax=Ligilactobacillus acidipiscis TaxID=89059 RepID=A0A921F8X0_9LACO|nr:FAD-binding protein [Ligilactobacillus acidipiscis]
MVSAETTTSLAAKIHVDPKILSQEIKDFNFFAEKNRDYKYNRDPETLREFGQGPFYVIALVQIVLNTPDGPLRNSKAEVLDTNEQPIPHLYSAGEFGGICANDYQGGSNMAECLIFGRIAGENAAKEKSDTITSTSVTEAEQQKVDNKATLLKADNYAAEDFVTHDNQYIGRSTGGIGDEMGVRITVRSDSSL